MVGWLSKKSSVLEIVKIVIVVSVFPDIPDM
jgi:hypothetical protein